MFSFVGYAGGPLPVYDNSGPVQYVEQPFPGQQPYPGQQQYPGQQPYPGQPYPGQPGSIHLEIVVLTYDFLVDKLFNQFGSNCAN